MAKRTCADRRAPHELHHRSGPITLDGFLARGSLAYSGQTYLYSVFRGSDVRRNGYAETTSLPSPLEFVTAHSDFVLAAILERSGAYLRLLFLDREWLLMPLPGVATLVLLALLRGHYPRTVWPGASGRGRATSSPMRSPGRRIKIGINY